MIKQLFLISLITTTTFCWDQKQHGKQMMLSCGSSAPSLPPSGGSGNGTGLGCIMPAALMSLDVLKQPKPQAPKIQIRQEPPKPSVRKNLIGHLHVQKEQPAPKGGARIMMPSKPLKPHPGVKTRVAYAPMKMDTIITTQSHSDAHIKYESEVKAIEDKFQSEAAAEREELKQKYNTETAQEFKDRYINPLYNELRSAWRKTFMRSRL